MKGATLSFRCGPLSFRIGEMGLMPLEWRKLENSLGVKRTLPWTFDHGWQIETPIGQHCIEIRPSTPKPRTLKAKQINRSVPSTGCQTIRNHKKENPKPNIENLQSFMCSAFLRRPVLFFSSAMSTALLYGLSFAPSFPSSCQSCCSNLAVFK